MNEELHWLILAAYLFMVWASYSLLKITVSKFLQLPQEVTDLPFPWPVTWTILLMSFVIPMIVIWLLSMIFGIAT